MGVEMTEIRSNAKAANNKIVRGVAGRNILRDGRPRQEVVGSDCIAIGIGFGIGIGIGLSLSSSSSVVVAIVSVLAYRMESLDVDVDVSRNERS